jgi:hypothetical protein
MSSDSDNVGSVDEPKVVVTYGKTEVGPELWAPPQEWLERLVSEYAGQHDGEALPPGSDPNRVALSILTLSEEESVKTMEKFTMTQKNDYTVDHTLLQRLEELIEGNEACGMERGEWAYQTCKRAGIIHNWSPYAEVRAVTLPYDDPDEPCESFRAYILGFFWVIVVTAVNTCMSYHKRHRVCNADNQMNSL